jgi:hypothetical protein
VGKTRNELRQEAEAVKGTSREIEGLVPVDLVVKQNADIVFSVRFTQDEMTQLREAAQRRGIKLSELVREGALAAAASAHGKPSGRDAAVERARQFVEAAAQALEQA